MISLEQGSLVDANVQSAAASSSITASQAELLPSAAAPPIADAATQGDTQTPQAASSTGFMKKSRNRGNIRKRQLDGGPAVDTEEGPPSTAAPALARRVKLPKAEASMAFTTRKTNDDRAAPFQFTSSRNLQQTTDQGATATLETETAFDQDARWLPCLPHLRTPGVCHASPILLPPPPRCSLLFIFVGSFPGVANGWDVCSFSELLFNPQLPLLQIDVRAMLCNAMAALQSAHSVVTLCRALREQVLAQAGPEAAEGAPTDGLYRGINNYTDYKKARLAQPPNSCPSTAHCLSLCGLQTCTVWSMPSCTYVSQDVHLYLICPRGLLLK